MSTLPIQIRHEYACLQSETEFWQIGTTKHQSHNAGCRTVPTPISECTNNHASASAHADTQTCHTHTHTQTHPRTHINTHRHKHTMNVSICLQLHSVAKVELASNYLSFKKKLLTVWSVASANKSHCCSNFLRHNWPDGILQGDSVAGGLNTPPEKKKRDYLSGND